MAAYPVVPLQGLCKGSARALRPHAKGQEHKEGLCRFQRGLCPTYYHMTIMSFAIDELR